MKNKGFILLGMLFLMLLLAVTAVALNRRAGLQARMAGNQTQSVQTSLGQVAAVEDAVWGLTKDPCWRTSASGEDYTYNGTTYNRKVLNSSVTKYTDSITVSVTAPGAANPVKTSFRYYIDTLFLVTNQVCCDNSDNVYFADSDNHSIWKIDATTEAITRVAGDGQSGYSGDGGLAIEARLHSPEGVCVDTSGNIYIADTENHRIRKFVEGGNINTIAGTGTPGYSGDGEAAIDAKLNSPHGVCVHTSGNIYIADTENHRIRKFVEGGNINTIAGTGTPGYSPDPQKATEAKLNCPLGVCVHTTSGNIYIADTDNHRIRRVDAATGEINTIAGTGTPGYSPDPQKATEAKLDHPSGVCVNSTGKVVISDTMNTCLRQIDIDLDTISFLFPPAGPAKRGLNKAQGIDLDTNGNLYIADTENHLVRKVDTLGMLTIAAGTGSPDWTGDEGPATEAQLYSPHDVALDSVGNMYIADTNNHCIRKVGVDGIITTVAGTPGSPDYSGDGEKATDAQLDMPQGVAADITGEPSLKKMFYISDTNNHCIREVNPGGIINTVAGTGFFGDGGDGGPATSARLYNPQGLFVESSGNIYIADTNNHRIRKVESGTIDTIAGNGSQEYSGDGGLATSAGLKNPRGVFVDNAGNIFIADTENYRIRVVSTHDQKINTLAGTGTAGFNVCDQSAVQANLWEPSSIAMTATRGGRKIYISDTNNNRIRVLTFKIVKEL